MGEIGKLGDTITQLANKVEDKTKAAGNDERVSSEIKNDIHISEVLLCWQNDQTFLKCK